MRWYLACLVFASAIAHAQAPIVVRVGTVAPEGTPWERQMKRTRAHIEADGAGRVQVKVYLGGKKGDEKSLVRQCRDGRIELIGVSSAALATEVPALQVLELPFLFESSEEADFVLDKFLYEPVSKLLGKHGFVLYQWAENGWQNIGLKQGAVHKPGDLAGRKMRSQESPVHIATWKAFGASPVEMAVSEVLPSLQTGLVDGFAQTPLFTFAAGWHQGIQHYTLSRHVYQPALLVYAKSFYDAQPQEIQKALMGNVVDDTVQARGDVRKIEPGLIKNFEAYGIKLYELTVDERGAFAAVAEKMRKDFAKQTKGDARALLDAIEEGKKAFRKGK